MFFNPVKDSLLKLWFLSAKFDYLMSKYDHVNSTAFYWDDTIPQEFRTKAMETLEKATANGNTGLFKERS